MAVHPNPGVVTVDSKILTFLRHAGERAVAGADLARMLGVTPDTLGRHVEALRALGYEIEASPHLGYRLRRAPDALHPDDLLSRLGTTHVIGREIRVFQETTSTNDLAELLARGSAKEGAVVFAEAQTRGRGRHGRTWVSPAGKGLWLSVLLRPKLRMESVTQLTIAAAVALSRAIRNQTELRPDIKWPNDLLLSGKKVAGILTELSAEPGAIKHVVIGIGVNVNMASSDLPPDLQSVATSLKIECGHDLDRAALAAAILREFDNDYARVNSGHFEALADEWESQCSTLGHAVSIHVGQRRFRGRAESLDSSGALLLRTSHGHLERISAGDVTMEGRRLV